MQRITSASRNTAAREPDPEERDHARAAEDERAEHDDHDRRGGCDHAPGLGEAVADSGRVRRAAGVHSSWIRETRNTS